MKLTNNRYLGKNEHDEEIVVRLSEAKAFGDLDGDGVEDAVVVLVFEPVLANGTFVYLAAVTPFAHHKLN